MVQLVGINNEKHKNLAIDINRIATAVADERTIPVVLSEFQKIAVQKPIVFTKNAATGQFVTIAMLGFDQGENLYYQADKWSGFYTPLSIMRQPFFVGGARDNSDEYSVCVDMESPAVIDGGKKSKKAELKRIFDEDGKDTEYFQNIKEILVHLLQQEKRMQDFIEALLEFDLIAPLQFNVAFSNQQSQRIDGLYSIDEEKLNSLTDSAVLKLHSEGLMKPIYTMIASLEQIPVLIDRKNNSSG